MAVVKGKAEQGDADAQAEGAKSAVFVLTNPLRSITRTYGR